jgi:pimeloyl-ACP methyl ester carboxylesterase
LILFDKRGTGLSDRVPTSELPTLEQRMDDVRAVMDEAGSERAALLGISEGGPMCALFAATYPERTSALVMVGSYARRIWAPDYPWAPSQEEHERLLEEVRTGWGGPVGLAARAPSLLDDERFRNWWCTYLRMSASPGAAHVLTRMNAQIDVRHVLPTIRVPTLIVHRTGDRTLRVEGARYMAERIPGARYVELPGDDHLPFVGDQDEILDEIEEFLTGARHAAEPDRVLATVLFTDIVDSTRKAAELGNRGWLELLDAHHAAVRRELERFRGNEVDTAGDGFFATLTAPRGRSAAPLRSLKPSASWGWRYGRVCTRASASSWTGRWVESRSTSGHAWPKRLSRGRCSSRARSRIWSPAQGWNSLSGAQPSSRGCLGGGSSMRSNRTPRFVGDVARDPPLSIRRRRAGVGVLDSRTLASLGSRRARTLESSGAPANFTSEGGDRRQTPRVVLRPATDGELEFVGPVGERLEREPGETSGLVGVAARVLDHFGELLLLFVGQVREDHRVVDDRLSGRR